MVVVIDPIETLNLCSRSLITRGDEKLKKRLQIILLSIPLMAFAITSDELIEVHSLTTTEINALSSPAEGLLVFDKTLKKLYVYTGQKWEVVTFEPKVEEKTGDYTLTKEDNGVIFRFNTSTDVTLTIPSGLPVGFNVSIYQVDTGKVIIHAGNGVTIKNRLMRFKTAGKDAGAGIVSTSADVYHITGDLRR